MMSLGVAKLGLQPSEFMSMTPGEFFTAMWIAGREAMMSEIPVAVQTSVIANALGSKAKWHEFMVRYVPKKLRTKRRMSAEELKRKAAMAAAIFGGVNRGK